MADLEDFFAKRDKKKKSKGKKFESVDIDDVAKVLDAKAKERKKMEVYQPEVSEPVNDHGAKEDEDWKEIPDDTPDFTGLKIQEFTLADEEEANGKEDGRGENDKDYEGPWKIKKTPKPAEAEAAAAEPVTAAAADPAPAVQMIAEEKMTVSESPEPKSLSSDKDDEGSQKSGDGRATPEGSQGAGAAAAQKKYLTPAQRAKLAQEAAMAAAPTPTAQPSRPVATLASGASGVYIPPSQRAGMSASGGMGPSSRLKTKKAPNIDSEEYFPSLSGGRS